MMGPLILIVVGVVLFFLAKLTKRRCGVLILGLGAGVVLGGMWQYEAALLIEVAGVKAPMATINSLAAILIIIFPALAMLIRGPRHRKGIGRVVGPVLFALFGIVVLSTHIAGLFPAEGPGVVIFRWLSDNYDWLVTIGFLCAIIDVILSKPKKTPDIPPTGKSKKH